MARKTSKTEKTIEMETHKELAKNSGNPGKTNNPNKKNPKLH